jgi:hypothetical protein
MKRAAINIRRRVYEAESTSRIDGANSCSSKFSNSSNSSNNYYYSNSRSNRRRSVELLPVELLPQLIMTTTMIMNPTTSQ